MTETPSIPGPVFLRWRDASPAPEVEQFKDLDAALDAVEARWESLQHCAPAILDQRRVLLASTEDLKRMMETEAG